MLRPLTCAALTLSLLSACSTTSVPQTARPGTLMTVPAPADMTDARLADLYGGTVEYRTASFAVISDAHPRTLMAASASGRAEPNERRVTLPHSTSWAAGDKIWATGDKIWATGDKIWATGITTWASGDKIWATGDKIWATGDKIWATSFDNFGDHLSEGWNGDFFRLFPENSDLFAGIGVRDAQLNPAYQGHPVIAVVDGPMDVTHPALGASLVPSGDWYDFASNDAEPTVHPSDNAQPAYGHATAVAGVALQVAPRSRILPVQVLAADGSGYVLDLVKGVLWAVDHGADIINLSVGTDTDSPALRAAVDYAHEHGVDVVAAAGNSGSATLDYPAAYVAPTGTGVAVGSLNASGTISSFSSTGPAAMLFAPGEALRSLYPDGREASWNGTSFSTPVVSGALAVLRSRPGTPDTHLARLFDLGGTLNQMDQPWKKLNMRHLLD